MERTTDTDEEVPDSPDDIWKSRPGDAIAVVGQPRTLPGTGHGLTQPIIQVRLSVACPPALDLGRLASILSVAETDETSAPVSDRDLALAALVARWANALQLDAGHPLHPECLVVADRGKPPATHLAVLPYSDGLSARATLRWTAGVASRLVAQDPALATEPPWFAAERSRFLNRLLGHTPRTLNTPQLHEAARGLDVPWMRLAGTVFQIGHGVHARRLDSTMTDRTSAIGTALARNKQAAAEMLRGAGIPASTHRIARSADDAAAIANRLGYPVVIKPIDLDGGLGVAAGLRDEESLRHAYDAAAAFDRPVLVEKHVDGEDFRLLVIGGEVAIAITREPGGVTGDGASTLSALLARVNADPRRGTRPGAVLKSIEWNEEAAALAREQGLDADSVPAPGRFVRLRRAANIATGGMPVLATDRVHPDNLRLAVRAAELFDLDMAGIDYITPDIRRPWYEVGGVVNEVNAQPSFGIITAGHLYGEIVRWMLKGGNGRIPIATVTSRHGPTNRDAVSAVHAMLLADGRAAGCASTAGAWVGSERMSHADMSGAPGGRLLLTDRRVAAAVIEMPRPRVLDLGTPFDHCDVVTLIDYIPHPRESDLIRRARVGVVVPLPAVSSLPPTACRVTAVSRGGLTPDLGAHRDRGGVAMWTEPGDSAVRVVAGDAPVQRIATPRPPSVVDLFAVATAHALGCSADAIGRALATWLPPTA